MERKGNDFSTEWKMPKGEKSKMLLQAILILFPERYQSFELNEVEVLSLYSVRSK